MRVYLCLVSSLKSVGEYKERCWNHVFLAPYAGKSGISNECILPNSPRISIIRPYFIHHVLFIQHLNVFHRLFEPALLLALSTLLLHPLTPRRLARQLFNFAVSVALRVALLARGFHRVDTGGLVSFRGGVPGFGAGDCADCGL